MTEWLTKIDPTLLFSVLSVGLGWLYHKARGDKQASIFETARGLADQAVQHALMAATGILDGIDPANAAAKVNDWVWAELATHGIAKNDAIDLMVKPLIADAVARVLAGLRERLEQNGESLDAINTAAQATVNVFATAEAEGLARVKDMASMVERVPLDDDKTPIPTGGAL